MGMKSFTAYIALVYRTFSTTASSTKTANSARRTSKNRAKDKPREPRIQWTDEQKYVLAQATRGMSLFITGSAGTGKTVLLKKLINNLRRVLGRTKVFVTASTGLAACAIQGQTLHSYSGIGLGNGDRETLLNKVLASKYAWPRWRNTGALVIDEISMIDAATMENLEYIARKIRGSDKPWGGIQLIACGDFLQLPPVIKGEKLGKEYAFEADCWEESYDLEIELKQVFRQADSQVIKLLQGIRKGETDAHDLQLLEQSCSMSEPDPLAVWLYPRIEDVNRMNEERMKSLGEQVVVYEATDGGREYKMQQLNHGLAPDKLELCLGARVMLIANLNTWKKLCNGATGTVVGFVEPKDGIIAKMCPDNLLPVVKFDSGPELVIKSHTFPILDGDLVVAWRSQIPLLLAWAVSVHKCQGMTLDRVYTDLSRAFGYGMVYVALSRVRSLEGLCLSGFCPSKIKANPKVLRFYERLASASKKEEENEDLDNVANEKEESGHAADHSYRASVGGRKYSISPKFMLSARGRG